MTSAAQSIGELAGTWHTHADEDITALAFLSNWLTPQHADVWLVLDLSGRILQVRSSFRDALQAHRRDPSRRRLEHRPELTWRDDCRLARAQDAATEPEQHPSGIRERVTVWSAAVQAAVQAAVEAEPGLTLPEVLDRIGLGWWERREHPKAAAMSWLRHACEVGIPGVRVEWSGTRAAKLWVREVER